MDGYAYCVQVYNADLDDLEIREGIVFGDSILTVIKDLDEFYNGIIEIRYLRPACIGGVTDFKVVKEMAENDFS